MEGQSRKPTRAICIVAVIGLVVLSTMRLDAQTPQTLLAQIISKLDEVLAALSSQGEAVEDIQTTVNGIPSVLLTPELTTFGRAVSCSVTNGSASAATAETAILDSNGGVVATQTLSIPADGARSVRGAAGAFGGLVHCRVTVTVGDKRALRAALCVHEGVSTLDSACMAVAEAR